MTTWYTSDLHFNHEGILVFGGPARPWKTVEHMNDSLTESWNSVVSRDDEVYVLGDFILGKPDEGVIAEIVCNLNGWINLIPGNHDSPNKLEIYKRLNLLTVKDTLLETKNPRLVMCHFPLATWHHDYIGMWHLHGHTHGTFPKNEFKRMDVGVDTHPEHRPYHIDEIAEYMKDKINKGNHRVP